MDPPRPPPTAVQDSKALGRAPMEALRKALELGRELFRFRSLANSHSDNDPQFAAEPPARVGFKLRLANRVESFIALTDAGKVIACNGHVDLGTGVRTAFAQIVAEELDVRIEDVTMIMGDTDRTPDQGPTTASASIQDSAVPMRWAAAQVRHVLMTRASQRLGVDATRLRVTAGVVICEDGRSIPYQQLLGNGLLDLEIDSTVAVKDPRHYTVVGKSVPRLDIPSKVTGSLTYVHDVRLPGMLHARVVRPPYTGRDSGELVGRSLVSVDVSSIAHVPRVVRVVTIGDFVAVVAKREEHAIQAARALDVKWRTWPELPDLSDLPLAIRARPGKRRPLKVSGDVDLALANTNTLEATYVWPYQMHASIGPSCGVADFQQGTLSVWTGSQNPHLLHADLVALTGVQESNIRVVRMEASGCYGRNCADDAAAEAALLAMELGCPVRVQLMREEEHGWEPKGTAQIMEVRGALTAPDKLAYDFLVRYPSNNAPLLALLHTGRGDPNPVVERKGDRTAVPQYRMSDAQVVVHDMAPIVRAAWLRGVAALPNVFAHESFIDELAAFHHTDPIEFRLRLMEEPRAIALTQALARHAEWIPAARPVKVDIRSGPRVLLGRGFAQHQYMHGSFPGVGAAWCAWICDVEVDTLTGTVRVRKVWVGFDCGLLVNPAGVRHQIHGNVIQSVSRVLKEQVVFDRRGVVSTEWGGYPILDFTELPEIDILMAPPEDHPPLGVGESASVPSAAAIANALHSACGVRLREAPFTPDRVRAALAAGGHSPQ